MNKPIIVALDFDQKAQALSLLDQLDPDLCRVKVGKEMFTLFGPEWVKQLRAMNFDVFLDLKFHDIPHTVAQAVTAAADLGVWMVNLHSCGGLEMMRQARQALHSFGDESPLLIAVTILTSMSQQDLELIGVVSTLPQQVERLARLAADAELDGVVCSAQEAGMLRSLYPASFKLVTPGIRPENSAHQDQKRVMTPRQAIAKGSDYLVIGRPITHSQQPMRVLASILDELDEIASGDEVENPSSSPA